jgi:hypothetical protein
MTTNKSAIYIKKDELHIRGFANLPEVVREVVSIC